MHDLGPSLSAFNAFQLLQGLETLDLRMARHTASALGGRAVPRASTPPSRACTTPASSRARGTQLARDLPAARRGSVFSFDLHATGDADADFARVEAFIARLRGRPPRRQHRRRAQPRRAPGVDDAQPPDAATQLADAGITPTTIRLSIGLEDPGDIIADLDAALAGVEASAAQSRPRGPATSGPAVRPDALAQPAASAEPVRGDAARRRTASR